jgi:hypothetical protein
MIKDINMLFNNRNKGMEMADGLQLELAQIAIG